MGNLSKLMLMGAAGGVDIFPESVDLDGTNDYLSRSSDFVGNTNSKTFTLNFFVYFAGAANIDCNLMSDTTGSTFKISCRYDDKDFCYTTRIRFANISAVDVLDMELPDLSKNTFYHVCLSIDLANSSNRFVFINDVNITADCNFTVYINDEIDFTVAGWLVGTDGSRAHFGRLAHVFLDYTYRDLSIEANRRLFITEDLKPATGLAALNPIMYCPMKSPEDWHVNKGTGGDFTPNGTVALSGRGPNQDNCVASEFDGVNDYLGRTTEIVGSPAAATEVTVSVSFGVFESINNCVFGLSAATAASLGEIGLIANASDITLTIGATVVVIPYTSLPLSTATVLTISINTVTGAGVLFINGVDNSSLLPAISALPVDLENKYHDIGRSHDSGGYLEGYVGELYLDDTYIDLSTDNPFWDSETNLPIPVRNVIENTGVTPLIAMPIRADSPALNLGTGGDFTLVGGPLVGARGASEFWARSVDVSSGDLSAGVGNLALSTKTMTIVIAVSKNTTAVASTQYLFGMYDNAGVPANTQFYMNIDTSERFKIYCCNSAATIIFSSTSILNRNGVDFDFANEWDVIQISIDLANANSAIFTGNYQSTITTETDDFIDLNALGNFFLGANADGLSNFDGKIGFFYLSDQFVDFSDESERLKFVDALGYPVDIQPAIDAGDIPEPLIYMPFDDPDDLGKNNGTGGDFTVNGSVIQGADVDPNA